MIGLPGELIVRILTYCPLSDLLALRLVSQGYRDLIDTYAQFTPEMQLYIVTSREDDQHIKAFVEIFKKKNQSLSDKTIIDALNSNNPVFLSVFTNLIALEKLTPKSKLLLIKECTSRLTHETMMTDQLKSELIKFAMKVIRSMTYIDIKHLDSIFYLNLGYYDTQLSKDFNSLRSASDSNLMLMNAQHAKQIVARFNCLYNIASALDTYFHEIPKRTGFLEYIFPSPNQHETILGLLKKAKSEDSAWFNKWITCFQGYDALSQEQSIEFKQLYLQLLDYPAAVNSLGKS